ncbi:MAG: hypothetical protein DBX97_23985 [Collinsella tanakaei]|nr:MAG: hypothetical protein DBX97_23985 [Collinsella tanakaei]
MKATEVAEELKRNLSSLGPKERSRAIAQVQRVIRAALFDDSAEVPEVRCCVFSTVSVDKIGVMISTK